MSLNLSDPGAIVGIYESIATGGCNWLLLRYSNPQLDEMSLSDYGSEGLEELKSKIDDLDQVFIAFYREEIDVEPGFIVINYIPSSISGVRRARALVHSRRVAAVFKKHQTTLTVDNMAALTLDTIHRALGEPDSPASLHISPTIPPSNNTNKALPLVLEPVRRSVSEAHTQPLPTAPPMAKSPSMLSNFIRRKKKTEDSFEETEGAGPPPTPPKDKGKFTQLQPFYQHIEVNYSPYTAEIRPVPQRERTGSISEFAVISHASSSDGMTSKPTHTTHDDNPMVQSLPLRGKWAPDVQDPTERARRRREAQRIREIEEAEVIREEAERQAELKRRKDELRREEAEEEARRRASLENELRRIAEERKRKERLEKEEEERKKREFEERKRLDRERRLEEHRRLEEWRREQARLANEAARRAEDARRHEEEERRKKIRIAEAKVKRSSNADTLLTGWVTIQTNDSLFWKRRFYKFTGSTLFFCKNPKDIHLILDKIELRGKVRGLREWNEGYEDLEAIPHSFAIEFKDGCGPWSMYADSEEEKYKLLGLLHHAAGL